MNNSTMYEYNDGTGNRVLGITPLPVYDNTQRWMMKRNTNGATVGGKKEAVGGKKKAVGSKVTITTPFDMSRLRRRKVKMKQINYKKKVSEGSLHFKCIRCCVVKRTLDLIHKHRTSCPFIRQQATTPDIIRCSICDEKFQGVEVHNVHVATRHFPFIHEVIKEDKATTTRTDVLVYYVYREACIHCTSADCFKTSFENCPARVYACPVRTCNTPGTCEKFYDYSLLLKHVTKSMTQKKTAIFQCSACAKVTICPWSMGGLYARCRAHPPAFRTKATQDKAEESIQRLGSCCSTPGVDKVYKCYCCAMEYNALALSLHIFNSHTDTGILLGLHKRSQGPFRLYKPQFRCNQCNFMTLSSNKLEKHVEERHTRVQCEYCLVRTTGTLYLKIHVEQKHDFKCPVCSTSLPTLTMFIQHCMVHDEHYEETPKSCPICLQTFSTAVLRQVHIVNWHGKQALNDVMNKDLWFSCSSCNEKFVRPQSLQEHTVVCQNTRYGCVVCPEQYTNELDLTNHLRLEHDRGSGINYLFNLRN